MSATAKLIFGTAVEPLVTVSEGKLGEGARKRLQTLRIGAPHRVEPAYPAESWAEAVKIISAELFPKLKPDDQHRALGKLTVTQFAEGFMGRAMFTAAKVFGARRSIERMTRNLQTGANFIQTTCVHLDDRTTELWMNDVSGVPGFYAGLLVAGAEFMSGWPDQVEIKAREGVSCTYLLRVTV